VANACARSDVRLSASNPDQFIFQKKACSFKNQRDLDASACCIVSLNYSI